MLGCKRVVLLALVALVLSAVPGASAADEKDCEVCVKVVNDVKGVYTTLLEEKKGGKKLGIAETALGKYCGKKLSTKDNKLCYFLEPLKKDVARQITYGKDSFKICKSLEKKNPDFCSMRYPTKTDVNTDYTKMRVKQLKKILSERNVECVGCVEKADFIKKIKETESQHTEL
uniref:Mesencephalic astrocyte-derived neurotrophic factor homolog n=1 Tax=Globisporangium ultimum (strain ATCC 200006 / CBS 805.95 / DAOM BR144) TaxID=431595 RepID=K3WKY5_GLOUD